MMMPRNIIIAIVLLIGVIGLQVFLSKKESKVAGLILPMITFAYSLLILFSVIGGIGEALSAFFFANLPTAVLLMIYFSCRGKIKKDKELEKMTIKDLE